MHNLNKTVNRLTNDLNHLDRVYESKIVQLNTAKLSERVKEDIQEEIEEVLDLKEYMKSRLQEESLMVQMNKKDNKKKVSKVRK